MSKIYVSIVVVFVAIAGLLIFQASRGATSVVLKPSELLIQDSSQTLSRIRVAGTVSALPVEYSVEPEISLKFTLEDPGNPQSLVPVVYHGLKPDMFAPGRDVIIDGEYSNGVLTASKLLTQCPSKYTPPDPASQSSRSVQASEG